LTLDSGNEHRIKDIPTDEWLPTIYAELKKLAKAKMANERVDHSMGATALVHEAWLRLENDDQQWDSPGHYFASAAICMHRILIEHARKKNRIKHGGGNARVAFDDVAESEPYKKLVDLVSALAELAKEDAIAAKVVDLHHFGGLRHELVAETLGITVYQARQKWNYSRAWLKNRVGIAKD